MGPGSTTPTSRSRSGRRRSAHTSGGVMREETMNLKVARYRPEHTPEPYYDEYDVPYREDMVVLDALNHVKDEV
ncbi:MAG: 2Fe-2S iron-sulfur cluster-binding protein, partial [Actinomycetota bacterium]